MQKPSLAWAITGSSHNIKECLDFLLTLDAVDVYISHSGSFEYTRVVESVKQLILAVYKCLKSLT